MKRIPKIETIIAVHSAVTLTLMLAVTIGTGCGSSGSVTPSSLVKDVQAVGDAASVAQIAAAGFEVAGLLPPADAQIIESAAAGASTACAESIVELESTDSNTVMISKITGFFSTAAVNTAGMPAQAAALVTAISAAVQVLLQQLGSPTLAAAAVKASSVSPTTLLSSKDKKALTGVLEKAKITSTDAKNWKPVHAK